MGLKEVVVQFRVALEVAIKLTAEIRRQDQAMRTSGSTSTVKSTSATTSRPEKCLAANWMRLRRE